MPIPRRKEYQTLLKEMVGKAVDCARTLSDAASSGALHEAVEKSRRIERSADDTARKIFELMDTAPDLPNWVQDRWDFVGFTHGLDDLVDHMEEIVSSIDLFGLNAGALAIQYNNRGLEREERESGVTLSGSMLNDFCALILHAAELTLGAVPMLEKMGKYQKELTSYIVRMSSIERAGDGVRYCAIKSLLSEKPQTPQEVETRRHIEQVIELFEDTLDAFKHTSVSVKTLMLKNA